MGLKNFDYKKFLMEKGERVGLYAAAGIAVLMMLFAVIGAVTATSASQHAEDIKKTAKEKNTLIDNASPSEADKIKDSTVDEKLLARASVPWQDPAELRCAEIFTGGGRRTDRRYNPNLYTPEEFRAAVVLAQVKTYEFQGEGKDMKVFVLKQSGKETLRKPGKTNLQNNLGGSPGLPSFGGGKFGGMGGMGGMGGSGGMKPPGAGGLENIGAAKANNELDLKPVAALNSGTGEVLADFLKPVPMAVVVGSFPLKQQVEEFKKALNLTSDTELINQVVTEKGKKGQEVTLHGFSFLGVDVQRRTVGPDGKPGDWAKLDIGPKSPYASLMIYTDRREEPEDPKLTPVIVPGLAMPRPVQILPNSYPSVELQLSKINAALENVDAKTRTAAPAIPASRFEEGFDPFAAASSGGTGNDSGPGPSGLPDMTKPGSGSASQQLNIPDYCVVRFLDVTLEPGKIYEYQVRVKMINPNYHKADNEVAFPALAEKRELVSPWADVKDSNQNWVRVSLPGAIHFYAVDQKPLTNAAIEKDVKDKAKEFNKLFQGSPTQRDLNPKENQVVMQIHRWIGIEEKSGRAVGDWVVAERVVANRGDFVGQWAQTKLPYFSPTEGDFALLSNPKAREKRLIPFAELNFGSEPNVSPFLVDFDGGKVSYQHDAVKDGKPRRDDVTATAPVEVLMLTPDGRLIARDSATDENDKDREIHRNAWVKRVRQIDEEGKVVPSGSGPSGPGGPGIPGVGPGGNPGGSNQ